MLGLKIASSLAGDALEHREKKKVAQRSALVARHLTSLHLEEFPREKEPIEVGPPRKWNNLWLVDSDERDHYEQEHAAARERWERLLQHDAETVIATVDDALADNVSVSACVDAGTVGGHPYVTLVVHFPVIDVARGLVEDDGGKIRERTRNEVTALYQRALASTVIATVNEAFCSAPAATYAKVAVFSYRPGSLLKRRRDALTAIYAATLHRSVLDIDWASRDPRAVALSAEDVVINTDRHGALKPLGKLAGDDIHALRAHLEEPPE